MILGDLIKEFRANNKLSLRDFAQRCGLSHTYISALEKNIDPRTGKPIAPTLDTIKYISKGMNISIEEILKILDDEQEFVVNQDISENELYTKNKLLPIPILGRVPAGEPLLAEEHIEGYLPIDPSMYGITNSDDFFFLRVAGESMNKLVKNGSYVLVKKQDSAEDGDVVVAIVNGDDEATLKRFKELDNGFIALKPESTFDEFIDRIINLKDTNFKILGKVIGDFKKW